jgi:hypothetical protein
VNCLCKWYEVRIGSAVVDQHLGAVETATEFIDPFEGHIL